MLLLVGLKMPSFWRSAYYDPKAHYYPTYGDGKTKYPSKRNLAECPTDYNAAQYDGQPDYDPDNYHD